MMRTTWQSGANTVVLLTVTGAVILLAVVVRAVYLPDTAVGGLPSSVYDESLFSERGKAEDPTATLRLPDIRRDNDYHGFSQQNTDATNTDDTTADMVTSKSVVTINLVGDSTSDLLIPQPQGAHPSRTLPEFLSQTASDATLLGTKNFIARSDGLWDCRQPSIGWFGLEVSPIFVNRLDRPRKSNQVIVTIVDARAEIIGGRIALVDDGNDKHVMGAGGVSKGGRDEKMNGTHSVLGSVIDHSTFVGRNALSWSEGPTNDDNNETKQRQQKRGGRKQEQSHRHNDNNIVGTKSWILSADLSLSVILPIPKMMRVKALPPGFDFIASRIMRLSCRRRVKQNLLELRDAYVEWALLPGRP